MTGDTTAPPPGIAEEIAPDLRRVVAPNPSPMTHWGTNTYILGRTGLAVIDPGPDDPAHLRAILEAVGKGQRITHILVSHSHADHSPLARELGRRANATVLAFGDAGAGRSAVMAELARGGMAGGGEGIDREFSPDLRLSDGERVVGDGWELEAIHTPGHLGNHVAFAWGDACFTADHVMGWASSLVSPPDGDLTDYMASCQKLKARDWRVFHPGHGAPVVDPAGRLEWLIRHRREREEAILAALANGPLPIQRIVEAVYLDTPPALHTAAARNVFAHLVDLAGRGAVRAMPDIGTNAIFSLP